MNYQKNLIGLKYTPLLMRNYGPRAKGVFQKIIYPRIICYPGKIILLRRIYNETLVLHHQSICT